MKDKNQLTIKQERFAQEWFTRGNGTEAYRIAYNKPDIKMESANRRAKELMDNSKILARVKELRECEAKKHEVTRDMVLKEYALIAFLDVNNIFNDDGTIKKINEIDEDTRRAIAGVEVSSFKVSEELGGALHKVKLADKKGALDSIAKLQGWVIDKKEITGKNGGKIEHTHEEVKSYKNEEEAERAHRDLLKDN